MPNSFSGDPSSHSLSGMEAPPGGEKFSISLKGSRRRRSLNNWHKCATKEALFSPALLFLTTLLFATGHNHPCERTEPFSSNRRRHGGLFRRRGGGERGSPLSIMFRKYALARKREGGRGEVVKLGNFLSRRRRSGKGGRRISEGAFDKRDRQGEEEKKAEGWNGTLLPLPHLPPFPPFILGSKNVAFLPPPF